MAATRSKFTTTHTILASAILLMVGIMACPNTPWDRGDPTHELELMHTRTPPPEIPVRAVRPPALNPKALQDEPETDDLDSGLQLQR